MGEEAVVRALQSARRPPAGTLSRLTLRQLAEATVGTIGSASIAIDLLEAATALVLCEASRIPVPLAPMLKAHGREAPTAIDRVGANLGLLAGVQFWWPPLSSFGGRQRPVLDGH